MSSDGNGPKVWKLVLTGGPCGGKTTGQARLCTFFENLGWKVYRAPETANILLSGGVKFADLSAEMAKEFQSNLLKTMLQIENTFFDLAKKSHKNCLVICDRGAMDASAYIPREQWEEILSENGLDEVELRDNRYNQVIHMITAAKGAEEFYTLENHTSRSEGLETARMLDTKAAEAWVGHPNVDSIGNTGSNFQHKINALISRVAWSIGLDIGDRLMQTARKVKLVVNGPLPSDNEFPERFRDFEVVHHYLQTTSKAIQSRLRKRGRKGKWTYIHTIRRVVRGQLIEEKRTLTSRDYSTLLNQVDPHHYEVYKTRRCFLWQNQYYQLDIYKDPCHERCQGMMLLETYTTLSAEELRTRLPGFLKLGPEVTGEPAFSMYNLTLKAGWIDNDNFCHHLSEEKAHNETQEATRLAQERFDANKSKQGSPNKISFGATCTRVPENIGGDKKGSSLKDINSEMKKSLSV